MKTGVIIWSTMAIAGVAAVIIGNMGHLYFSVIPSAVLALSEYVEYRRDKKRKAQL